MENRGEENSEQRLSADEARENARLMREVSEVFARQEATPPDVQEAWQQFRRERLGRRERRGRWLFAVAAAAVAAGVALLLRMILPVGQEGVLAPVQEVAPPLHTAGAGGVTLTTTDARGDGRVIAVSPGDSLLLAQGIGVKEKSMDYRQAEVAEWQQLDVPRGHSFRLTLADGTEVWLNAETRLGYPSRFEGTERRVELEGEAYFRVAREGGRPFVVSSRRMTTRVTGTEFNMKVRPDEAAASVVLLEGKVFVKAAEGTAPEAELVPGEEVVVAAGGQLEVREADTYACTQWKEGYFYFDNEELHTVAEELGRWFDVEFEVRSPELLHRRVHYAASRLEPLDKAVENLDALGGIRAVVKEGKVEVWAEQ